MVKKEDNNPSQYLICRRSTHKKSRYYIFQNMLIGSINEVVRLF